MPIVELGEKIWYHPLTPAGKRLPVAAPRFEEGWFLGFVENSNAVVVADATGQVVKARCLRRRVESERWDPDILTLLQGAEIQPNPGTHDTRIRIRVDPGVALDVQVPPPVPAPPRIRGV